MKGGRARQPSVVIAETGEEREYALRIRSDESFEAQFDQFFAYSTPCGDWGGKAEHEVAAGRMSRRDNLGQAAAETALPSPTEAIVFRICDAIW